MTDILNERSRYRWVLLLAALVLSSCTTPSSKQTPDTGRLSAPTAVYETAFKATFSKDSPVVEVEITLNQTRRVVRELDFNVATGTYQLLSADGSAELSAGRLVWQPPAAGGTLRYSYDIAPRPGKRKDARHTSTLAIARLGDLFPAARARTLKGATNSATLSLVGPAAWSFETAYGAVQEPLALPAGERNFNRPLGWLLAGKLGIRRATIADIPVAVAAPVGSDFRRMDTLTFLNWVLPDLKDLLPAMPPRILILGAPSGMWRGGLSAPGSLYMHEDRPLISENGTSTLIHELVHVAGVHSAAEGADWLVEGIAEYLSVLVLHRSGGTSERRFARTLTQLEAWAARDAGKLTDPSSGANTAAAVLLLHQLDLELQARRSSFDRLLAELFARGEFSQAALVASAEKLLRRPSTVLTEHFATAD